jgi:hypothetical protein
MERPRLVLESPEGMFVFSKFMKTAAELSEWAKHFTSKAIRTQIMWCEHGFYLCREGVEAVEN